MLPSPARPKAKNWLPLASVFIAAASPIATSPLALLATAPTALAFQPQYPRLSGQHAQYTAAQLVQFRDGVRLNSPQMTGVAAKLNDREIKAVSDYIAGLR